MVVQFNDEPDIIVGGDDPPIATAVPVPAAAAFNNPNKNIERVTNADGSLTVKATTTSRQPNGYRDVTIEYFYVPANMASTVIMSMDSTGDPPSSLYLTKMEQQVLPPGTGEVVSHAPSVVPQATAANAGGANPPQPYIHEDTVVGSNNGARGCAIFCGVFCLIIVILAIIGAATGSAYTRNPNYWPTPAPYYYYPPSPWNPSPWSDPTPKPTKVGCKDTPDWVDGTGSDCDWYDSSNFYCSFSSIYAGSMGPATIHCCVCGGGSTYVAPTPRPSISPIVPTPSKAPTPRPTQPSSCRDTPGWVDFLGNGCDYYTRAGSELYDFCDFSDAFQGEMGPATENCCSCGGGTIPSTPSKAPATSGS